MEKFDPDKTILAKWVVDSESGSRYLLDLKTSQVLAKWVTKHKHELHYSETLSNSHEDVYMCKCGHSIHELNDLGSGC